MDRDKARAEGALYHLGDLRIAAAVRWEARAALGDRWWASQWRGEGGKKQ